MQFIGPPTECFALIALLLIPPSVSPLQFISRYKGSSVSGLLGSSLNFTWSFSGDPDAVDWGLKNPNINDLNKILVSLIKAGSVPIVVPPAYTGRVSGILSNDSTSGYAVFTLSNITKNDENFYGCKLRSYNGLIPTIKYDFVRLLVLEKPVITHFTGVNTRYNEGNTLNISCAATGKPEPHVRWIHNEQVKSFGPKSTDLIFNNIRKEDAGLYTCRANNSAGSVERTLFLLVNYTATIQNITSSVSKSWIGQKVTLKCVSDGFPTPALTWKKANESEIKNVTAEENTVTIVMKGDQDFGLYTCKADNGVGAPSIRTLQVRQIKAPGFPSITSTAADIEASSLTVRWTAPADGGSPITAYRVVILQGDNEIINKNITDPAAREKLIEKLNRNTNYNVKVYARNFVFEGDAGQKAFKTNFEGVPLAADIFDLPAQTKEVEVVIKWNEPQNNGAPITQYTVYQRTVSDDGIPSSWQKLKIINDVSVRHFAVQLEKGKKYEFVVTATNKFGESFKGEEMVKRINTQSEVPNAVKQKGITDAEITLEWEEPFNNGANITQYSVYQRMSNHERWRTLGVITDISKREYVVKVEKDNEYEFVVTATNKLGESPKDNIETVKMSEVLTLPPESKADSSFGKEKLFHIIYISVIVVLSVSVLTLVFVLWRMRSRLEMLKLKRKRKSAIGEEHIAMDSIADQEEADVQPAVVEPKCEETNYATPGGEDYMPLHPSTRSWELNREQVNVIKIIGKGAFSEVAKATIWNFRENKKYITVAAKMLKANAPASDRKDLLSELELMTKLKPHPHVIKLIGCVTESDPLLVLIEFVPFGDLLGYLRKSRGLNDTYFKDPDVKPQTSLTAEQLMRFAWQIADGMCYLSSKKIIHRDLAARNVLVGEGEKCKVTDFGMARNVQQDDIYSRKSRGRLPVKWTAYEALLFGIYTTQSDVWSYGILLYEIVTVGGCPYPDINARQIAQKLQEGYRMPKPTHVDSKLYEMILKCWEEQPTDRPKFEKLRKTMKQMEKNHKTYVNLSQYDESLYANVKDLADE